MNGILTDLLANDDLSKYGEEKINLLNQYKRLQVILLIDTSGAMFGHKSLLKQSVEKLYDEILSDKVKSNAVEISLITFNGEIQILEKMREIKSQESRGRNMNFSFGGGSLMGCGLKTAISQLEFRKKIYMNSKPRIKYYAPILFILSNGLPYCYDARMQLIEDSAMHYSRQYIQNEVSTNRLVVFSCEVGNSSDRSFNSLMCELTGLGDDKHVIRVDKADDIVFYFRLICSCILGAHPFNRGTLNDFSFKDVIES